jgi:hypothetical protein
VEDLHGGDGVDERRVAPDELVQALRRHLLLEARQQDVFHHAAAAASRHPSSLLLCRRPHLLSYGAPIYLLWRMVK